MFQLEEGMTAVTIDSSTAAANIAYVKSTISAKIHEDERAEIRKWLYPDIASSDSALNFALNMRHPDTGNWFLESKEFETWKGLEEASLWVYGIGTYLAPVVFRLYHDLFSWKWKNHTFVSIAQSRLRNHF